MPTRWQCYGHAAKNIAVSSSQHSFKQACGSAPGCPPASPPPPPHSWAALPGVPSGRPAASWWRCLRRHPLCPPADHVLTKVQTGLKSPGRPNRAPSLCTSMCRVPPERRCCQDSQQTAGTGSVHTTMRLEAWRLGSAIGHSDTHAQGRQQQLCEPQTCLWARQQLLVSFGTRQALWVEPDRTEHSKPSHAYGLGII